MPLYGTCPKCGGETRNYECVKCYGRELNDCIEVLKWIVGQAGHEMPTDHPIIERCREVLAKHGAE